MKPYYQDLHNTLYCLDFRKNDLPDESVQMVVTSPPYWGLRKYSGEQELIWGDNHCEHEWQDYNARTYQQGQGMDELAKVWKTGGKPKAGETELSDGAVQKLSYCSVCSAWKGAYGLEPTPEMYVQHTIEILREIRRVLRKDGVVFWNIGDSYVGSGGAHKENHANPGISQSFNRQGVPHYGDMGTPERYLAPKGMKPKDLCLIPFRVAIAAQEDGWWVRSVIIWSKPNPMPESVQDRPTESHEYILMLTKNSRYYWDADAVREPLAEGSWERSLRSELDAHSESRIRNKGTGVHGRANLAGRNIRTVWDFPTQPYPEAHFAVFPEKLPELCIKAATPEVGCCSKCGAPWERIVERQNKSTYQEIKEQSGYDYHDSIKLTEQRGVALSGNQKSVGNTLTPNGKVPWYNKPDNKTVGWQPTCKCNADKVPATVLDPFSGAGTSLWVAKKLNRQAIGYEISEEYCQLTVERLRQQVLL